LLHTRALLPSFSLFPPTPDLASVWRPPAGEMVCDECIQPKDVGEAGEQPPPPAPAAAAAAASGAAGPGAGATQCVTCGAEGASKRKASGEWPSWSGNRAQQGMLGGLLGWSPFSPLPLSVGLLSCSLLHALPGLVECHRCHRYRQRHEGQPRPEAVWSRDKRRQQPQARGRGAERAWHHNRPLACARRP
jgi:hypothetical protein